jgi:hypothetical protein
MRPSPTALLILALLCPDPVLPEQQVTAANPIPARVFFSGPRTSPSGFEAVTQISYDSHRGKRWPNVSVRIEDRNGREVYHTVKYAAWFATKVCWDDADRLWIASADTGVDVLALTAAGWRRHRWLPDSRVETMFDAETGETLSVVEWEPPPPIRATGD